MPELLIVLWWLATTLLLGCAAWTSSRRLYPAEDPIQLIMPSLLLAWASITVTATALSLGGILRGYELLAVVAILSSAVILCLAGERTRPMHLTSERFNHFDRGRWPWLLIWCYLLAFGIGHVVTGGLLRFPSDWDTLMYHLPLVDHWLQAQDLYAPDCLHWSNPGNNELLTLWLVAPFSGDFLALLTNLPASVLLVCASFALARQLHLSVALAHLTALAVVGNYIVLRQLVDTENDVASAALFLASTAYGFRYVRHFRRADLFLGAMSLGLLAGVKYYALGYTAVAGLTVTLLLTYRRGVRVAGRAAVVGVCGILVFGGYWYVRNLAAGGSPLYPLGGSATMGDLSTIYPGVWQTTFIGNRRPELLPLGIRALWEMTGPCHLAAFLLLPLSLIWLIITGLARSRQSRNAAGETRLAMALLTVLAAIVLLITPFAVEDRPGTLNQMYWLYCPVRYGLCFLSLSVFCMAVVLQDLLERIGPTSATRSWSALGVAIRGSVFTVLAVGIAFQVMARGARVPLSEDAALVAINVGNLFLVGMICRGMISRCRYRLALLMLLGTVSTFGGVLAVGWLSQNWHQGYAAYYDRMSGGQLFTFLSHAGWTDGSICVLDYRPYPFFGSRRQFRVCQPATITTYASWLTYVRNQKIKLLVTRFDRDLGRRGWYNCQPWVEEHEDLFAPIRDRLWRYGVYQVVQNQLMAGDDMRVRNP